MKVLTCLLLIVLSFKGFSQDKNASATLVDKDKLPIPNEKDQLFYLQRDPNTNTVIYSLNMKDGKPDPSNPVLAYWIRYADTGEKEKLSFMQRRMAYGISHKEIQPGVFEMHLQAYKALTIRLSPNSQTGKYQALVKVKDDEIILNRLFARVLGGSIFKPKVEYIEVYGTSLKSGKNVCYRFDL